MNFGASFDIKEFFSGFTVRRNTIIVRSEEGGFLMDGLLLGGGAKGLGHLYMHL